MLIWTTACVQEVPIVERPESKVVAYFPDFLLQVPSRQELINLLDYAVTFVMYLLHPRTLHLVRSSVNLRFQKKSKDYKVQKISGPWLHAVNYCGSARNAHYDSIFEKQFFDLNQHRDMPLDDFVEVLCENFTKYQRYTDDRQYQIIPREKQSILKLLSI